MFKLYWWRISNAPRYEGFSAIFMEEVCVIISRAAAPWAPPMLGFPTREPIKGQTQITKKIQYKFFTFGIESHQKL